MYGYVTSSGYKGKLPDGTWMLFTTEEEYKEYIHEDIDDVAERYDAKVR